MAPSGKRKRAQAAQDDGDGDGAGPAERRHKASATTLPEMVAALRTRILHSNRQWAVPEKFKCPLNGDLMANPVVAPDGVTYDFTNIKNYVEANVEKPSGILNNVAATLGLAPSHLKNAVVRRPCSRGEPMPADYTKYPSNAALRQELERWVASEPLKDVEKALRDGRTISELSEAFVKLDELRPVLAETLKAFDTECPKVIVLGNEQIGKSTLLERLAMMKLFPRQMLQTEVGVTTPLTTRMAIHVRLRQLGPDVSEVPPIRLMVHKLAVESGVIRGMVPDDQFEPIDIPVSGAVNIVQDTMDELQRKVVAAQEEQTEGLITDRAIVLDVARRDVPSIDLIDLPGLVAGSPGLLKDSKKIAKLHIDTFKAKDAIFLHVTEWMDGSRMNGTQSAELIQEHGLQKMDTLGVFTKCDYGGGSRALEDGPHFSQRVLDLFESHLYGRVNPNDGGGFKYKHGFIATMNRMPTDKELEEAEMGRLEYQGREELKWFLRPKMRHLFDDNRTTVGALVGKLGTLYMNTLRTKWAKNVFVALAAEQWKTRLELAVQGPGTNSSDVSNRAKEEISFRLDKIDKVKSILFDDFEGAIGMLESATKAAISKINTFPVDLRDTQKGAGFELKKEEFTKALDTAMQDFRDALHMVIIGKVTQILRMEYEVDTSHAVQASRNNSSKDFKDLEVTIHLKDSSATADEGPSTQQSATSTAPARYSNTMSVGQLIEGSAGHSSRLQLSHYPAFVGRIMASLKDATFPLIDSTHDESRAKKPATSKSKSSSCPTRIRDACEQLVNDFAEIRRTVFLKSSPYARLEATSVRMFFVRFPDVRGSDGGILLVHDVVSTAINAAHQIAMAICNDLKDVTLAQASDIDPKVVATLNEGNDRLEKISKAKVGVVNALKLRIPGIVDCSTESEICKRFQEAEASAEPIVLD